MLGLGVQVPVGQRDRLLIKGGLDPANLKNLKLVYKNKKLEGEMVNRKGLEDLEPEQFNSILILADESEMHMLPPGGSGTPPPPLYSAPSAFLPFSEP